MNDLGEGDGLPAGQHADSAWRSALSAVLVTVACVLAPLSLLAVWANTRLLDTEAYLATVAPLADDPAVQQALADEVTAIILEFVNAEEVATQVLTSVGGQLNVPPVLARTLPALTAPIVAGVEGFVGDQVAEVVASDQFARVWVEVNTVAHGQVVTFLEGTQGGVLSAQDDAITLNLGPIVEQVRERLIERGFTLVERVPPIDRSVTLVEMAQIGQAQGLFRLLTALGVWLPIGALVLLALGVLLARDRRLTVLRGSLGAFLAVTALAVALALTRSAYADASVILPAEAATRVFDTLIRDLMYSLRVTAIASLVVALVAYLSGRLR